MSTEEIRDLLTKYTSMSRHTIEKHLRQGVVVYPNTQAGRIEYAQDMVAGGEDDIASIYLDWDKLDVAGDYKIDFVI